jgi:hypothetical protein
VTVLDQPAGLELKTGETVAFEGLVHVLGDGEEDDGDGPLHISIHDHGKKNFIRRPLELAEMAPEIGKRDAAQPRAERRAAGPYTPKIIYDIGRFPAPRPANKISEICDLSSEAGRLLDPNVKHVKESGLLVTYEIDSLDLAGEIGAMRMLCEVNLMAGNKGPLRLCAKVALFNTFVVLSELLPDDYDTPTGKRFIEFCLQDIKSRAQMGEPWT